MTGSRNKSIEKTEMAEAAAARGRSGRHRLDSSKQGPTFNDGRCAAGNLAVQQLFRSGVIQAKLRIGQPDDMYEQEADQVADRVMRSAPVPSIQRKCAACAAGAPCSKCEEAERVQAKEAAGRTPHVSPTAESSLASLRGGGRPLPTLVRAFFERRLGADFSHVRVHTDAPAANIARSIQARAFTAGADMVFAAGEYDPNTSEGRRLLAHELTHVLQQRSGASP